MKTIENTYPYSRKSQNDFRKKHPKQSDAYGNYENERETQNKVKTYM